MADEENNKKMEFSSSATTTKKVVRKLKSEKRKEKCRAAARHHRSQEMETFTEMAKLLPLPNSVTSQLDKASIMRLTIGFLKLKSLLDNSKLSST